MLRIFNLFYLFFFIQCQSNNVTVNMLQKYSKDSNYFINNPGCAIRNITMNIPDNFTKASCGTRKVFIQKVNTESIIFYMTEKLSNCCYTYIQNSVINKYIARDKAKYSKCRSFQHGTKAKLLSDFIFVKCTDYEDVYGMTKKLKKRLKMEGRWNILIIGIDRMSRIRAYNSLKKTVTFLKRTNWLDFKGYNKVARNTYPNLVRVLSGMNDTTFERACSPNMNACNHLLLWSQYEKKGYVTAYGEDSLYLGDTFFKGKGLKFPLTNHYMRPLFVAAETKKSGTVCSKKLASGEQILIYIVDFIKTYENNNFFGFFWINSFSHDTNQSPKDHDSKLKTFFKVISKINNTFILFMSDHGLRYGDQKKLIESFYEDKLPMLFMKVPNDFKKSFPEMSSNLQNNQNRLISPNDVYLTLRNLLNKKNTLIKFPKLETCPNCHSLFEPIPRNRTCSDAGIELHYCACHNLEPVSLKKFDVTYSLVLLILRVQNIASNITTVECTVCAPLKFKKALRSHYFLYHGISYYLVAFTMSPSDISFEGLVSKDNNNNYEIIGNVNTISVWRSMGACAVERNYSAYCVCQNSR